MRPQPAKTTLCMSAADDDEIRALPKRGFADNRRHRPSRQQDFHVYFGLAAQTDEALFGCVEEIFSKFYLATIVRGLVGSGNSMDHRQSRFE